MMYGGPERLDYFFEERVSSPPLPPRAAAPLEMSPRRRKHRPRHTTPVRAKRPPSVPLGESPPPSSYATTTNREVPQHLLPGYWSELSSPRTRPQTTVLSPLPELAKPESPRNLPRGLLLKQIGDGSYLPVARWDGIRPSTHDPLRSPLFAGELQREEHRRRMLAVEAYDAVSQELLAKLFEKDRLLREKKEAEARVATAEAEERMRIAEQFAEREAQLRREAAEVAKIETREKKAKKPKKKALKGEVEKDSWAWRNGGAMEQGPRPVGLYYDEVDEALRRAVNRQSRDNLM